jgi:hypothetical protein
MSKAKLDAPSETVEAFDAARLAERWTLSPSAARFIRDRAEALKTDPVIVLEDLILVERRRVEGAI